MKQRLRESGGKAGRSEFAKALLLAGFMLALAHPLHAQSTVTNLVTGNIAVPGQRDNYTFSVSTPTRFYFDALSNSSSLQWSLGGADGAVVANRSFTGSDAQSIGDPTLLLPGGDYTMTIQSSGGTTNQYGFRFIDLRNAALLAPGSVVTNALTPANRTDLYQFAATAGDRYFFDVISRVSLPNTWWRLMDPYGNQIFSQGFSDVGTAASPVTLSANGTYTLMVEGYIGDAGSGTYAFNVVPEGNVPPAPLTGTPINLGDLISGALAANSTNAYTFTVTNTTAVILDPLTNCTTLNWSLQGPPGLLVNQRSLNSSGGIYNFGPISLPPGNYQLSVLGSANAYEFRLLSLSAAASLTLGTVLTNVLSPASAAVIYQFNATAGNRYFFDSLSQSSLPDTYWRLVDPNNQVVFSTSISYDQGPLTLNHTGSYKVLIEGYWGDPGSGYNVFKVAPDVDGLQALTLGNLITGTISSPGQHQQYSFTLSSAARLYFDSLTNNYNVRWSLDGPDGNLVNARTFSGSDAQSIGSPLLPLPAGTYTLTVYGSSDYVGGYQFRLFDLATAAPMALGTAVNGTLNPADSTTAYQFTLAVPTKVFLDYLSSSGLPDTYLRLVDGNGNVPIATSLGNNVGPLVLPAGSYTLLVEGYIGDGGSGSYAFNLDPVVDGLQALTLGNLTTGAISSPGQHQQYTFTLGSAARLYFDSLTNTYNVRWSLDGPAGNLVNTRTFSGSDAQSVGSPLLPLPPGTYTLTVFGSSDYVGGYQFRLFDLATATPMTLGTAVNGTLNPADSTTAYQFTLTVPTKVFLDFLSSSGLPDTYVRLVDGNGNVPIATGLGNSVGPLVLPAGSYTLLVEGYIGDAGSGSYVFSLDPVLDGLQSLTLGSLTTGAISSPGQHQQYSFTLNSAARLYFDSFTNAYNVRWSLDGPAGNIVNTRTFSSSDAQNIANPLLSLPAGNYTLTVFGNSDYVGGYQFRLFDLATAAPMSLGTAVNGTLNPANSTTAYQFSLAAPTKVFFDYLSSSGLPDTYLRLVDGNGNVPIATGLGNNVGPLVLPAGSYTLLVEGYIGDGGSGSYAFNLDPVADGLQTLTLGSLITGALSSPGQRQQYTFTLGSAARLYFDSLTNAYNVRWSLDGPTGNFVNTRTFSSSDAQNISNPLLPLPAGNYTLTVFGNSDYVGGYQFRLFDLATATTLTVGIPFTVNNQAANATAAYQFTAAAGDQFSLLYQTVTGMPDAYSRLVDPYNNVVVSQSPSTGNTGTNALLAGGTYTWLIEGYIGDGGTGAYTITAKKDGNTPLAPFIGKSLTLGTAVTGSLATNTALTNYVFTLGSAARLYFDALTNVSYVWSLTGPQGAVVNARNFSSSDSADIGDPALPLPAGTYQLTISGSSGGYSFNLLDFATATPYTAGTIVTNTLAPANSTAFYQFTGSIGQQLYFNGLGSSGFTYQPYCRLYGPLGNIVMAQYVGSDVDTFTLTESGTYTLTVEGRVYDTHASGTYAFNLLPITYATNTLTLGQTVTGNIPTQGVRKYYTVTLPSAATLYFDALTNADFDWRLDAPWGQIVNWRPFSSSDSVDISDPSLVLPAGTYQLAVAGDSFTTIGDYQFRLLNFTNALAYTPGVVASNTLAPANSTVFYRFTGTAGQQFYFNGLGSSGFSYQPYCRLYGPLGNIVMAQYVSSDVNTFTLTESGTYTLTVEGRVFDPHASGSYAFNLLPVSYSTNALAVGQTVSGNIPTRGVQKYYTLTLPSAATLYFDALTNADFLWRLDAPWGQVVNWRSFSSSDSVDIGDPSLPLPAGTYQLTVSGDNAVVTGNYQFRLLNFTNALAYTPGVVASNTLAPANSTVFYQFTGSIGQQFYFNGLGSSGFSYQPYCRLYGPLGNIVMAQYVSSDVDTFTLTESGTYTLTVEGRVFDPQTNGTYAFNLLPITYATNSLTLGQTVTGNIPTRGVRNYYTVTLPSAATLYFDALTNADFDWRLDASWGPVVSWRSFSSSDSGDISDPSLALPAGTYQLAVAGDNFMVTGNYQFRLLNFTNAMAYTPGVTVSNTLAPANSTVFYQFTAAAGNRYYFDGQPSSGFSYQPYVRLYDPAGHIVMAQNVNSDVDTFAVGIPGAYTLTVEGRIYDTDASGTYGFDLVPNPQNPGLPLFPTNASPDLIVAQVSVLPASGLESGGAATVQWVDQNTGTGSTSGSFTDRVTIRNAASQVLVDALLPYVESDPGNGPIAAGSARNRQLTVNLPDGTNSTGTLQVAVTVDSQNAIAESDETNNLTSTVISVTLAPYPDLLVTNVVAVPASRWLPGSTVFINWQLTNSGNGAAVSNWADSVVVRHTDSSGVIFSASTNYLQSAAGNGPIEPGEFRNRSISFTMPSDGTAYGTFAVTVTADSANQVFEFNTTGTAEQNNSATLDVISGPDLVPTGLAVSASGPIQSGGSVNISWNDQNAGTVDAGSAFYDLVTVVNTNTRETLLNTAVYYNPATTGNGPIAPGTARARATSFQLPDGPRGAGTLLVSVALDTYGQVAEFNATGTAEANNQASVTTASAIAPYPDLQIVNLGVSPNVLNSGTNLTVHWQDTNSGNGLASGSWYDHLSISNATTSVLLLDTEVYFDVNSLGRLTNGTASNRSYNFTLPAGANGAGTLQVVVTADQNNDIYEYNPSGTAESNNVTVFAAISGIAAYPDLQVTGLTVLPASLASGTNVTLQWYDSNTGTAPAVGSWYDHLTVSNATTGATLAFTTVYYDQSVLGPLTNGGSALRSYNFGLPTSADGAGTLVFTLIADYFNNIFEYNPAGTGESNNVASIVKSSAQTPLPDLVISSLSATNTVFTSQFFTAHLTLSNQGLSAANADMVQQVYISSSPTPGSGTLSGQADFNGILGVSNSIAQTVSLLSPSIPGTYWLTAQADAYDNVVELLETNNYLTSATPLTVLPAYRATIVADIHSALANTPIPMHGQAFVGSGSAPAASVPVTIHILVRGTDRTYTVLTAADGSFTNVFQPLPNEAGDYQISAALPTQANPAPQDTFTLVGMAISQVSLVDLTDGTGTTNVATLQNLSDIPLTGLTVTVATNQPNLAVTASLTTNRLDSFDSASLRFTVTALNSSIFQSPVILHVASAEGATVDLIVTVRVEALRPNLVISPTSLNTAMQRGAQTPLAFTVFNQGGVASGPVQIILPSVPWLALGSTNVLAPLAPGSNAVVTILLTPASDLALGDYNGTIVLQSTNVATQVPFSFRAVSNAKGNLVVTADDEYTYFVNEAPHVTNALVTLNDALSGAVVATNVTGLDGTATFTNLTEAFYVVNVAADLHSSFRQSALVPAGVTTNVDAFLSRQTVSYDFTVTPTTVADQYTFDIQSTFETQVPIPVVTIEPASLDLSQYPGNQFQVLYTVANHGLIDAESVQLVFPTTSWLQMTALVTNLGKLKANSSYTVPVLVTRLPASGNGTSHPSTGAHAPHDFNTGTCSVTAQMLWDYLCGPNVVDKSTAYYVFDSTGCDLVSLYSQVYHLEPDAGTGTGTGGGGPVITSGDYFDYLEQLNPVTDFEPPPGYHFACNQSPPSPVSQVKPLGGTSVCAKVKIQLDQKGVLTRDAFKATLEINNDVTSPLQNVQAAIQITDLNGNNVGTNFGVSAPSLSGLTAIDGTGNLAGSTVGSSTWTLVPTLAAAPTTGMTVYLVGGSLSYTQDGTTVTVPLAPAPIQVFPQPELLVRYFHDRNVYADDPFTPQVEPSVPFSLAVQVNNVGYGAAQSLSISSGNPQIVDNLKGLLINFNIIGAQVENQPITPALTANLGSIDPGTNKIARWLFTSTYQGSFTNFSASFSEVDQLGNPRLSLIRSVEIHELTHIVDATGSFEDGRPDFLVDDVMDPNFLPDTLYLSDGSVAPVTAVTNANLAGVLGGTNLTVTVTASLPTGWSYLQFGDPGPGAYQLAHVFRTDHSEVPLGTNVWTTDRNFIGGDVVPVHTNLVHLLDYNSTGSYTLVYAPVVTNTVDTNPPTSLVSALPAASAPTFTVQWSGADNSGGSGLGFFDIYASTNGGPFGPWIQGTKQTAAVFNGTASTTYAFFSRATDLAGNQEPLHSTPDAHTATTVPANTPPVIAPIATQSLVEGSLFSFTPSATDAQTGITLTWNLLTGAPAGALIAPQTGHITWQTGAGDAGTTNQFVLVVTDNGSPSLSATQAFEVVVARLNHAPVIVPTASQYVVSPGSNLMVQLSANDSDFPQQTLTWQLSGKVPAGLNLGAATGLLAWTPQPSQANTTNLITVTVSDNGTPSLSASETFSIIVVSGNHAPSLAAIGNQSINVLQQLIFTNSATDSDRPAQVLTFSLDPGSPAGTFIDPDTGVFSWVPSLAQAHNTNAITVRVTDSGSPALSDAETFTVVVGDYLEILLGTTVLQAGESGTVTVSMNTTIPVTNVNFTLTVPEANLTNLAFGSPLPSLRSALLTRTGPGQYLGSFVVANSQGLTGTQVLASLDFTARADSPSAFAPLAISGASAHQLNGAVVPVVLSQNNRVAVVNNIPLLDALGVAGQFQLTVYAPPGIQYTVESTPNFIPPLIWTPLYSGTIGSGSYESIPIPITNSSRFFRIIEK